MNNKGERLVNLFNEYYLGVITEKEKKELFLALDALSDSEVSALIERVYNQHSSNQLPQDTNKVHQEVNRILSTGRKHGVIKKNNTSFYLKIAAAAVLLVLGYWSIFVHKAPKSEVVAIQQKKELSQDAGPAIDKATLTLANGTTIVLDTAKDGVLTDQQGFIVRKTTDNRLLYAVKPSSRKSNTTASNTLSTPRGGHFQVELPDGSKAWLNASSSISFPSAFNNQKREVSVTGEVYFEVAKLKTPFFVKSTKGVVEVLGTHFNIMAYDNEGNSEVTLLEGKVKVFNSSSTNFLRPGEQAKLPKKGDVEVVSNIDIDQIVAWKEGLFSFKNTPIEVVMRQLSRWYDLDVAYKNGIPDIEITGKIARSVNVSEVFSMLEYTGLHFKVANNTITIL